MRYLSVSCLVTTDIIHHIHHVEILQSHLERTERRTRLIPLLDVVGGIMICYRAHLLSLVLRAR